MKWWIQEPIITQRDGEIYVRLAEMCGGRQPKIERDRDGKRVAVFPDGSRVRMKEKRDDDIEKSR